MLHEKYRFPRTVADEIAAFLLPMIDLNPERRATAEEMLKSDWVKDVELSDDEGEGGDSLDAVRADENGVKSQPGVGDSDSKVTARDADGDEGME